MRPYKIASLVLMMSGLEMARRDAIHVAAVGPGHPKPDSKWKTNIVGFLEGTQRMITDVEFDPSLVASIKRLVGDLRSKEWKWDAVSLHARLDDVIEGVHDNLDRKTFMYVPNEDATYWQNPATFSVDVMVLFPLQAVVEIMEVGNCMVASRYTACVFHSMRVAEYGLRILARNVKVKLIDKGKRMPVEYGTWDKVITATRNEISSARQMPHSHKKAKLLRFYSDAVDHCEYMKDIWRNEIAHSRGRHYNRNEALGVMGRVAEFAQLLVSELMPKDPARQVALFEKRIQEMHLHFGVGVAETALKREDKADIGKST